MMVRFISAAIGAATAGITALVEIGESAPKSVALGWSVVAGIMGAGVTYGVTTARVNSAHQKIEDEKEDRIRAVGDLKADLNNGFDRIEQRLSEQTRIVVEAITRREL